MKRMALLIIALIVVMAVSVMAQNKYTVPWSGSATGGSFTWTNKTGNRLALSAANMTGPSNALLGGGCIIKMVMKSQTNWLAASGCVTNSLNFLDGAGALPIEALGEVIFTWPTTNRIQWSVIPKN